MSALALSVTDTGVVSIALLGLVSLFIMNYSTLSEKAQKYHSELWDSIFGPGASARTIADAEQTLGELHAKLTAKYGEDVRKELEQFAAVFGRSDSSA